MAYDQSLAERMRKIAGKIGGVSEKRMFGGLAFLKHDRMAVGTYKDSLVVKINKLDYDRLLKEPHTEPMKFTGKIMMGFILVTMDGYASDSQLAKWMKLGFRSADEAGPKTEKEKERARRAKTKVSLVRDVEAIIDSFPKRAEILARKLRQVIRDEGFMFSEKAYPGWKAIGFRHPRAGYVCGIFNENDTIKLVFEHGNKIKDPFKLLKGINLKQIRFLEFKSEKEIADMSEYIGDYLRLALTVKKSS